MPSISSGANTVASGTLSIVIDGIAVSSDTTCELLGVGSLKYSFDNLSADKASTSLFVRNGDCSITILDKLGDGSSFFDHAFDLGYETQVKVNMTLVGNDSNTYEFVFYFRRENVKVDEIQGECTVNLLPLFSSKTSGGVEQFAIDSYFDGALDVDPSSYLVNAVDKSEPTKVTRAVSSGRFIKDAMKVYSGFNSMVLDSDVHQDITSFTNLQPYNLVGDPSPPSGDTGMVASTTSMLNQVKDFAAREGAIFGYAFNNNFYTYRLNTDSLVSLDASQVLSIGSTITDRVLSSIEVINLAGLRYDDVAMNESTIQSFAIGAYKTFRYNSYQYAELTGQYRTSIDLPPSPPALPEEQQTYNNVFFLGAGSQGINVDTAATVSAYAAALSATSPRTITLTVNGIANLFPWNTFNITNTGSSSLRDNFADRYTGIVFRPSILSYSFVNDTIDVTAYEIGTV